MNGLVYCDYIAHLICCFIKNNDAQRLIHSVGRVEANLDEFGSYAGPEKTVKIVDCNGTRYKVTVELDDLNQGDYE